MPRGKAIIILRQDAGTRPQVSLLVFTTVIVLTGIYTDITPFSPPQFTNNLMACNELQQFRDEAKRSALSANDVETKKAVSQRWDPAFLALSLP